jgi:spore coat protein H
MILRCHSIARLGILFLGSGALCGEAFASSASGEPRPSPSLPGDDLFKTGRISHLRIELAPDALKSLRNTPREFVAGTVTEGTVVYPQVGIHVKGAAGSFRAVDDRPSLTLDFCQFKQDQKFHGLRRIHLNNSIEDPSFANERLGSELFQAAGVPAPRVTRATVVCNGRNLGLYVLKEGFTEDFLACHFKHVGGGLYEPEGGHDIDQRLKRNSVLASVDDRVALKALAAAAAEPDPARRWQRLEAALDTDRFLAFMAMEVMLGHRDGYCLARNNFRVYHDLDTGKVVFFPHGMDQLLGTADLPWQPSLAGIVAQGVMTTSEGRQRYAAVFSSLFTNVFKTAALTSRVDQLALELRPVLSGGEWDGIRNESARVKERIVQRQICLKSQLAKPPLKLIEFQAGMATLDGWRTIESPTKGKMDQVNGPGDVPALHIVAGAETLASWRTRALLGRGRYRFEGRARVAGVQPLPYGLHQGAGLRVGGNARQTDSLTGDSSWQVLAAEFQVEQATEEVEFICELRAQAGEAWFARDSLKLLALKIYEN